MSKLGKKVRDTISGFEGTVVSEHRYLNGCLRLSVQSSVDKDGKLPETQTFDEPQLVLQIPSCDGPAAPKEQSATDVGGPHHHAPKARVENGNRP